MPAEPHQLRPATGLDESAPHFVDTPEGRVAWHEAGEGAPPLVLLHGFSGHRDDFIGVEPGVRCLSGDTGIPKPDRGRWRGASSSS